MGVLDAFLFFCLLATKIVPPDQPRASTYSRAILRTNRATAGQPRTGLKTWIWISRRDTRRGELFSPTKICQTDRSFYLTKKPVGIFQTPGVFPDLCPPSNNAFPMRPPGRFLWWRIEEEA